MVCSTPREHEKQRKGGKRAKRSSEDRSTSTHSESKIDIRGKPTEGKPGKGKVGMRRRAERGDGRTEGGTHAARVRRNSRCVRSDRGLDRGTYAAEREGKYEHRTWWIGWSRRFRDKYRIWWIGWKEWIYSEWRITSSDNFGTYRRMCGFGGGECRSVNRTLREKYKNNVSNLITHN